MSNPIPEQLHQDRIKLEYEINQMIKDFESKYPAAKTMIKIKDVDESVKINLIIDRAKL